MWVIFESTHKVGKINASSLQYVWDCSSGFPSLGHSIIQHCELLFWRSIFVLPFCVSPLFTSPSQFLVYFSSPTCISLIIQIWSRPPGFCFRTNAWVMPPFIRCLSLWAVSCFVCAIYIPFSTCSPPTFSWSILQKRLTCLFFLRKVHMLSKGVFFSSSPPLCAILFWTLKDVWVWSNFSSIFL